MSTESQPQATKRPKEFVSKAPAVVRSQPPEQLPWVARFADGCLMALFLALTFLLGVFPLKDTDFWWHLRTGEIIRATGAVPKTDCYTFTVPDHPWIDLHWLYQVALSWAYDHGGIVAPNLSNCAITCAAVFL